MAISISSLLPQASAWRLATQSGGEITGGAGKFLYGSFNIGNLYMSIGGANSTRAIVFPYSGLGAGAGVGFSLGGIFGGSFSTADFVSSGGEWGRVYLSPMCDSDLTVDTIPGTALILTVGKSAVPVGMSMSLIIFGVARIFWDCWKNGIPTMLPAANFRAVAFIAGTSVSSSLGVNAGGCLIYINSRGEGSVRM